MDNNPDRQRILDARHHDPFGYLGAHPVGKGRCMVRAYLPDAARAWLSIPTSSEDMELRQTGMGFHELTLDRPIQEIKPYTIRILTHQGYEYEGYDPYSFGPTLSDMDIYLIGEGTHYEKYEKMGAHPLYHEGIRGVSFAVWAPNADGVSVVGDFNSWDGRRHQMRSLGQSGIWEIFIPGLGSGSLYKYEIRNGENLYLKSDPYGFFSEMRPATASAVWDISGYKWTDSDWMQAREGRDWITSPMAIYEVHLGSWMRTPEGKFHTYRELAHRLGDYVKDMGYTHIELMPLTEHPLDESWGYQCSGYFALTSRFGTPQDFMFFVDRMHQLGIGVIMDWVPAHFPKDSHGLAMFDGTFLYEHEHPFLREHQDWGTLIFNYGRTEVRSFLLNSALFWLEKYHIDGLRVDAVASMLYLDYSRQKGQWIPNEFGGRENIRAIEFIRKFNELCHSLYPGVLTIAEESTAWPMVSRPTYTGGLGFSLKWNMGWMNDTLTYFQKDAVYRKYHHDKLTFGLIYAFTENFALVLSHDEVVHGKGSLLNKMPGDLWQKFANLRLLLGYMYVHPGKKLTFMGAELAQWDEWSEAGEMHWHLLRFTHHEGMKRYVRDLNRVYASETALHEVDFDHAGFQWIEHGDSDASVITFIRRGKDPSNYLVCALNFTPIPRKGYLVGVSELIWFDEVFNSDSEYYWGGNLGNAGGVQAEPRRINAWQHSIEVTLPPLALVVFKPRR